MPEPLATLALETSLRVPGLGVLAVSAAPAAELAAYALHTALALTLLAESQPPLALTGTVEELARAGQPPPRALLLDFDPGGSLLSGTRLRIEAVLSPLF